MIVIRAKKYIFAGEELEHIYQFGHHDYELLARIRWESNLSIALAFWGNGVQIGNDDGSGKSENPTEVAL